MRNQFGSHGGLDVGAISWHDTFDDQRAQVQGDAKVGLVFGPHALGRIRLQIELQIHGHEVVGSRRILAIHIHDKVVLEVGGHSLGDPTLQAPVHQLLLDHGGELVHEESADVVDVLSCLEDKFQKIAGLTEHLLGSLGGNSRTSARGSGVGSPEENVYILKVNCLDG